MAHATCRWLAALTRRLTARQAGFGALFGAAEVDPVAAEQPRLVWPWVVTPPGGAEPRPCDRPGQGRNPQGGAREVGDAKHRAVGPDPDRRDRPDL